MKDFPISELQETNIRPDDLMRGQKERFAQDIRWLREKKKSFVKVACPACQSTEATAEFQKHAMEYVLCSQCGTVYMSPRPSPKLLAEYYSISQNYAYWNKHVFPASEGVRRDKIIRPRAERIADICRNYKIRTDVLVEVGAGFGTFCEEIKRVSQFKRIIAVEPTPDLAETCRKKGIGSNTRAD